MDIFKKLINTLIIVGSIHNTYAIANAPDPFDGFEINGEVIFESSEDIESNGFQEENLYIMYPKNVKEILRPIRVNIVGDTLYHEDDIVIGNTDQFDLLQNESINRLQSKFTVKFAGVATGTLSSREYRWFDSVIPYEIDSTFHESKVKEITRAADLWSKKTNLMLVDISNNLDAYHNSHLFRMGRIKFVPHDTQCSSYVGMRADKKDDFGKWQPINLAQGCYSKQILHEIGHALGLYHEQTRTDRDSYIDIHKEHIKDDKYSQYQQKTKYNATNLSEYDLNSIMHYSNRGFAKGDENTFSVKDQHKSKIDGEIGGQFRLSSLDIQSVNKIYPQKPVKPDSYYFPQATNVTITSTTKRKTNTKIDLTQISSLLKYKLPIKGYDQLGKFDCKSDNIGSTQLMKCTGTLSKSSSTSTKKFEAKISMSGSTPSYIIYMR